MVKRKKRKKKIGKELYKKKGKSTTRYIKEKVPIIKRKLTRSQKDKASRYSEEIKM